MKNKLKVLSLFDGMSCGQIALKKLGFTDEMYEYYASEIDKHAIKVTQHNFPNTIQLGDVTKVRYEDGVLYSENGEFNVGKIDLLIGGSPCQDLSSMGSRDGLLGEKSKLFFEYVRLLKDTKTKYFLLENNASMTNYNKDKMSSIIGVEPIFIDSINFSAQTRKRLYWTNIKLGTFTPLNLTIKDICQNKEDKMEYLFNWGIEKYLSDEYKNRKVGKNVKSKIRGLNEISKCLGTGCGSYGNNTGLIIHQDNDYFLMTPIECERLQNVPDNYTNIVSNGQRYKMLGNGWTVDVIVEFFRPLVKEYVY